jgi:hypothetical protein
MPCSQDETKYYFLNSKGKLYSSQSRCFYSREIRHTEPDIIGVRIDGTLIITTPNDFFYWIYYLLNISNYLYI